MTGTPELTIRYGQIDPDYRRALGEAPPGEDGPVWMVNLMSYRDRAEYADGRETTLTGREADDTYAPIAELAAVGASIVFLADVDTQLLGHAPKWDRVAIVRYPTRRSFLDLESDPAFVARHAHKDAGMAASIVMGCQPMAWPELPTDAPDWTEVPHPPTEEDGPVVVLHVLHFNDGGAETDMVDYQNIAGTVAVPNGVRISGWLSVEGTIIGDGRSWDQARFNAFPSRAAFMAVALDPDRLAAQGRHREVAIADTYTMILRPVFDRLEQSFQPS